MTLLPVGAIVLMAAVTQAPTTLDRILAVVNGDLITLSDVRTVRALQLVPAGETDEAIVHSLVERRLVLAELRRFQVPEAPAGAAADRLTAWTQRFGADVSRALTAAGVDEGFVARWIADDLRREAYLTQRFAALPLERRAEAIRLWLEGLRMRAEIVYRLQRF